MVATAPSLLRAARRRVSRRRLLGLLPNLISLGRLLAVPLAVWLMLGEHYAASFWLFVAAGISDALDGFLARNFGHRTTIGGYLDPLADKALLTSVYVTLGLKGHMADWLVILVVFRDVLIIGGALLYQLFTQALRMQPLFISKLNTLAQITLAAVVLADLGLGVVDPGISAVLVHVVAATTFLSGAAYVVIWSWRLLSLEDRP
ncbi:MAG: CDP-alcohol phosphatidyltransferase family protein [Rhodospirillaceae bacterium]|nr:CDP-alcohol phosphatidyltransferase family protein [Rhodospirillaceae bacterium]